MRYTDIAALIKFKLYFRFKLHRNIDKQHRFNPDRSRNDNRNVSGLQSLAQTPHRLQGRLVMQS